MNAPAAVCILLALLLLVWVIGSQSARTRSKPSESDATPVRTRTRSPILPETTSSMHGIDELLDGRGATEPEGAARAQMLRSEVSAALANDPKKASHIISGWMKDRSGAS